MRQPGRHPDPGQGIARELELARERERETRVAAALRQRGPQEGWRRVGDPGEPAFAPEWTYAAGPPVHYVEFFKDQAGIVHMTGIAEHVGATGAGTDDAFTLPAGYRPGRRLHMPMRNRQSGVLPPNDFGSLFIEPTGIVFGQFGGALGFLYLDGVTFRADQ